MIKKEYNNEIFEGYIYSFYLYKCGGRYWFADDSFTKFSKNKLTKEEMKKTMDDLKEKYDRINIKIGLSVCKDKCKKLSISNVYMPQKYTMNKLKGDTDYNIYYDPEDFDYDYLENRLKIMNIERKLKNKRR